METDDSRIEQLLFGTDKVFQILRLLVLQLNAVLKSMEVIEGFSAESVFGLARSRRQNEGLEQFWETGFWSDFLDPNKTYLSSFEQNFKRPVVILALLICICLEGTVNQLPKVVRTWCVLYIFDFEMCFAPQRHAIFHLSSAQQAPHPPL